MKKTYNVYSTKIALRGLKALSVSFIFALFFLGMSTDATAQLSTSRAEAGTAADANYSITLKAEVSVSEEEAAQILESELRDVRRELQNTDIDPIDEAKNTARFTFLKTTIDALVEKDDDVNTALYKGQSAMALQVARYTDSTQNLIDSEGIVAGYVGRLK
ncbi:MAG: hypothetical protein HKO66_07270 [Saprospiraceae bacterium]|nr:hypothetical protein [Bacteroidia bacterium]NNE15131.1 hypothetical protein [Saprospiraceae bacterium]NNL92014.1 hypothetical protein [Saprospiraceae bacterium]